MSKPSSTVIRQLIREFLIVESSQQLIFYHGTLPQYVSSILKTGLRATEGWGGVAAPGVFLSRTIEDAEFWARMSALKSKGLPQKEEYFSEVRSEEIAVLEISIPPEEMSNLVPRRKEFNLEGDMQFVGPIPPQWLQPIK